MVLTSKQFAQLAPVIATAMIWRTAPPGARKHMPEPSAKALAVVDAMQRHKQLAGKMAAVSRPNTRALALRGHASRTMARSKRA
jgi:hypothetical protein